MRGRKATYNAFKYDCVQRFVVRETYFDTAFTLHLKFDKILKILRYLAVSKAIEVN